MVDGDRRLVAFLRSVVPPTLPGNVAVVVFAFPVTAGAFIDASAVISPTSRKALRTGVPTELIRGDVISRQSLQAAAVLVAVRAALFVDVFGTGSSPA